ncbi:MAG: sigma E protease regulator RseP [Porticoccaceae bacterium]
MIDTLQMIFFTLVALGVLVTIHEYGHFWVARRCGVKVLRFSIGFGPALVRWHDRQGTEYMIAALPLGGYVKMLDEREAPVAEEDAGQAFNGKTVWQRMAVVAAGPLANFLLAVVAFWIVYLLGVQGVVPIIGTVDEGSVAARAKLEAGQEIVAVDGEPTPTLQALGEQLLRRLGEQGTITFTAKYPDSSLLYETAAELDGWQVDADSPDPIASIGIGLYRPDIPPVVEQVIAGEPAANAGLEPGDRILRVDGVAIASWVDWVEHVRARAEQPLAIDVARGDETLALHVTPRAVVQADGSQIGQVGMTVKLPEWPQDMLRAIEYGPLEALGAAAGRTWKTTVLVLDSIKKMVTGLISPKHLSGPITIAKVAGASAQHGLASYLGFLALLSVSLGVLNLLPVPVLDGGHLLYYVIEAVKGSPVSDRIQMAGYRVGLFMVLGLMVLALYNDVMRL